MKKTLKLLSILLVSINLIYTSDKRTKMTVIEKRYIMAKKSIDRLSRKDDVDNRLAIIDFYSSISDSSYKIEYPPSKLILKELLLLDDGDECVHRRIRAAFEKHEDPSSRK